MMDINIQYNELDMLVTMTGNLDTLAAQQAEPQIAEIEAAALPLVIDCAGLNYISSSGLRLFLRMRKAAGARGHQVTLLHVNPNVMDVLCVTHFDKMFNLR